MNIKPRISRRKNILPGSFAGLQFHQGGGFDLIKTKICIPELEVENEFQMTNRLKNIRNEADSLEKLHITLKNWNILSVSAMLSQKRTTKIIKINKIKQYTLSTLTYYM